MNKASKLVLLLVLTALLIAGVATLAACNDVVDPNEFVQEQGNTIQVVLNSLLDPLIADSVGKVSNGRIEYRLKPGSPIPEPGVTANTTAPILDGYIFDGYYECRLTPDGNVTYISNEKWDFTTKVTENVTLYGKWLKQYKIRINYVMDGVISTEQFKEVAIERNAATVSSIAEPTWSGNTFVQLYSDAACNTELNVSGANPFTHGCTQENPVCDVYAKFMAGRWTLIKTASDLRTINSGANLYFMAEEIDMSSLDRDGYTAMTAATDFIGKIEGNGCVIRNLNFYRKGTTGADRETNYCLGLFARVIGATIRNVTFEDCSVTGAVGQINSVYFYGFIAGRAEGECTFDNIKFVNCELRQLQFDLITSLSPQEEDAERAKIESNFFVGEGSSYQPEVVTANVASVKAQVVALIPIIDTYAFNKATTIQFC